MADEGTDIQLLPATRPLANQRSGAWNILLARGKKDMALLMRASEHSSETQVRASEDFQIPGPALSALVRSTRFAVSNSDWGWGEINRLNLAQISCQPGILGIVASDGHRLIYAESFIRGLNVSREVKLLLHRDEIDRILNQLDRDPGSRIELSTGNRPELRFADSGSTFPSLTGSYADYVTILEQRRDKLAIVVTKSLKTGIDMVLSSNDRPYGIRVDLRSGYMTVSDEAANGEGNSCIIPAEFSGEHVAIGLNSQYLLDFLHLLDPDSKIRLSFQDSTSACEFQAKRTDPEIRLRYVVMPMRLD